jgi:hypothetical protein
MGKEKKAPASPDRRLVWRPITLAALLVVLLATIALISLAAPWNARVTAAAFAQARSNPPMLRSFLKAMPKGGDLHVHLSGAIPAERYIEWAIADDFCVTQTYDAIVRPPCNPADDNAPTVPIKSIAGDQAKRDRLVNALSMRDFVPTPAEPTGHDHFFATFGRFGAVSGPHFEDEVVDLMPYYQDQAAQYVELMTSFSGYDERQPMVAAIKGISAPADKLAALDKAGLDAFVEGKRKILAASVAAIEQKRACGAARAEPGCKVDYRFIAQVSRNSPPDDVFVQTAIAAALVRADPMVVGFNYVQAEDAETALNDYTAQMHIIAFLAKAGAPVNVALHAGELWLGLVPPPDLTFHIREAVEIAGAKRIGHGVDLAFENDLDRLLKEMRERKVAVEINLTSNDQILGVRGADHPFQTYRAAGVPVVLSTDDVAVERVDLTNEYVRAARDYGLSYAELKEIARASLLYSFLPDSEKQKQLARFDAASADFERAVAARRPAFDDLLLIVRAAY